MKQMKQNETDKTSSATIATPVTRYSSVLERLRTLALVLELPPQRETGWQAALALRWRSECMHLSLAKDAAETADGVGKSLMALGGSCRA